MPKPCFLRKLGGGHSLLCSIMFDISSDSIEEYLAVKNQMFHFITTLRSISRNI